MAHQTSGMNAYVTSLSPEPESHHNKPEEHEAPEEKLNLDEDISIEEVLSTM